MATEQLQPELVRGFVRSSELIADLSWDTREPSENHVKQLERRVRRALVKSDIGDLIESRHRFGYRLRAIPATDKPVGCALTALLLRRARRRGCHRRRALLAGRAQRLLLRRA